MLPQLRLLQLLSPALPVGAYSYSQGLEWAVGEGWIKEISDFEQWLDELIEGPLAHQDLPLLRKLFFACNDNDVKSYNYWSQVALAFRDTAELRDEECVRAQAYLRVLDALPEDVDETFRDGMQRTPLAAVAWAAAQWSVELNSLLNAYAYNWLDATVVSGLKIIPLGQSDGQCLLHIKLPRLLVAVETSLVVSDSSIGYSVPSVAMASCGHELQYSRIFRS